MTGVPLLGPLLFLIYINDIVNCDTVGSLSLFADDTALIYRGSKDKILNDAQSDLIKVCNWTRRNYVYLHKSKCKYIFFNDSFSDVELDLEIYNQKIGKVTSAVYLGLTIDNKLVSF